MGDTLCTITIPLLCVAGLTFFNVYYTPSDPEFRVASTAVYQLNPSSPPFISAAVNFTVETRNPNKLASFFYDPLSAVVSYEGVPITQPVILPPFSLDSESTVTLSPVLGGAPVPVERELINKLVMDEAYGMAVLRLELAGKMRCTSGAFRSWRFSVQVACELLVGMKRGFVGQLPLLRSPTCKVLV